MTASTRHSARERILEQAFLLFLTRGFEATSMADIVHATGTSKGAVYHHFASKEELFKAALDRYFVDLVGTDRPVGRDAHGFEDAVRATAATMVDSLAEISSLGADLTAYYRFLFSAIDRHQPEVQAVLAGRLTALTQAAERNANHGEVHTSLDPATLAEMAITTIEGAALLAALEGPDRLDDLINRAVDQFLALVRASKR
ncbi:TetR/AcrR family transcriptional regulator [Agromyces laixinhei]|uniref:TetR/AcrR family transcriptional regulator n=1 Tax=Agromyces laixinhei TaxID=2585717 RepID=UPI0018DE1EBB|nr:TetR/AcrR family transcriptional regulator [Agromyces laixinhei]